MLVTLNPDIVVSPRTRVALVPSSGMIVRFSEIEAERIEQLRSSDPLPVEERDLRLLNATVLVSADIAKVLISVRRVKIEHALRDFGVLTVMPTERCNFRCTYCYESFERGRMRNSVVEAVKLYCDKVCRTTAIQHLAWFGGEPLLHPDIVADVTAAFRRAQSDHGTAGAVSITTNGYNLSAKLLEQLQPLRIDAYQITLDGPAKLHNQRRRLAGGKDTYTRIVDNILRVLHASDSRVIIRINMDSTDAQAATQLRDWLSTELFAILDQFGQARVSYSLIPTWQADTKSIKDICISDLRKFHIWWGLQKVLLEHTGVLHVEYLANLLLDVGGLACYAGTPGSYVIGSDARVYKCTVAFDLPENHVGTLQSNGTIDVDRTKESKWINGNALTDSGCGRCSFSLACQGIACPLVRIQDGVAPCPTPKKFYESILDDAEVAT